MTTNNPSPTPAVETLSEEAPKPDIKAAIRKLQDAAWNRGTDEYRDGVSDTACNRRYDAMVAARADCVSAADALITENTALREQLAAAQKLTNFVSHVDECEWWDAIPRTTCSCGLAELLENL